MVQFEGISNLQFINYNTDPLRHPVHRFEGYRSHTYASTQYYKTERLLYTGVLACFHVKFGGIRIPSVCRLEITKIHL